MNYLGEYNSFNSAYHRIVGEVRQFGKPWQPRGFLCRELRPASFSITDAKLGLYTGKTRRLNYYFWAVETLGYLGGCGQQKWYTELLCGANSRMREFVNEDTGLFDGAYGPRLIKSLPQIEQLLRNDPSTRQAVAAIWEPGLPRPSKDTPCTVALHFYADNAYDMAPSLGMTAFMRSNDLNWGTPYDVAAFCAIQCAMAGALGWHIGRYSHVAGSLHLYEGMEPKVPHENRELWEAPVSIPHSPCASMGEICDRAHWILRDLNDHLTKQLPRSGFEHVGENSVYASAWTKLLRWSWTEYERSQSLLADHPGRER